MRLVPGLLVLALSAFAAGAAASPPRADRASIGGIDYISLNDWCLRHHYEFRFGRTGDAVELARETSRLVFERDSNLGSINGVHVLLSWPVAIRSGSAYVAALDAREILDPLVFPEKPGRARVRTICLDPGHGGKDPGTQGGSIQEKRHALLLTAEVAGALKSAGFRVIQTRSRDDFVELPDRAEAANRAGADLFVSLHFNSSVDRAVSGIETYFLTPPGAISSNSQGEGAPARSAAGNSNDRQNILLAWHIQQALVRKLNVPDRGVHHARFAVLKPLRMPGVLIEGGFLSNPAEAKRLSDAQYRKKVARAVSEGIEAYCQVVEARSFASIHAARP
jgi:N-acetylmuramoyl-L-alanine amidase